MELALGMKLHLDYHRGTWSWWQTLTDGSDVKYVFPLTNGSDVYHRPSPPPPFWPSPSVPSTTTPTPIITLTDQTHQHPNHHPTTVLHILTTVLTTSIKSRARFRSPCATEGRVNYPCYLSSLALHRRWLCHQTRWWALSCQTGWWRWSRPNVPQRQPDTVVGNAGWDVKPIITALKGHSELAAMAWVKRKVARASPMSGV